MRRAARLRVLLLTRDSRPGAAKPPLQAARSSGSWTHWSTGAVCWVLPRRVLCCGAEQRMRVQACVRAFRYV